MHANNIRGIIGVLGLAVYLSAMNVYIFSRGIVPFRYSLLIRDYATIFGLCFYVVDKWGGIVSYIHFEFNKILIISIIINFVLVLAIDHDLIADNFKTKFYWFNGSILAVTLLIFISAIRHDGFKTHDYNAD